MIKTIRLFFYVGTPYSGKGAHIFDHGGYDDNHYGHSVVVKDSELIVYITTKSCTYEAKFDVASNQWLHIQYTFADNRAGLKLLINSVVVQHIIHCTPRTHKNRYPYSIINVGTSLSNSTDFYKFMIYGLEMTDVFDDKLKKEDIPSNSTTMFSQGYATFDELDKSNYTTGDRGLRSQQFETLMKTQFQLVENSKLDFDSLYFKKFANYSDGYLMSQRFFKSCLTNPEICEEMIVLWSFWIKITSSSGTHFWMGNDNQTIIEIANQNENLTVILYSQLQTCSLSVNVTLGKWEFLELRYNMSRSASNILKFDFYMNNLEYYPLCYAEPRSWNHSSYGYIVFGGKLDGKDIIDRGTGGIDDLYYRFVGRNHFKELDFVHDQGFYGTNFILK